MKLFIKLFILSLVIVLSSCLSAIDKNLMSISNRVSVIDPVTGKREISLESEQKEIKRATSQTKQLLADFKAKKTKVDRQSKYFSRVNNVFNKLKIVVHRQNLPWGIHLIENKSWNAFTIDGGKIFIYSGLFEGKAAVQSDDELAAILAHEMAHINTRHASEKRGKLLVSNLIDKQSRGNSYAASFTTIQEDEADKYSVIYSALAGYNPSAGAIIWQRMDKYYGSKSKDLLYDHPLNNKRAKSLTNYASLAKRYYKKDKINSKYKSILLNNTVFSYNTLSARKAGEGGGVISILETIGNAYIESKKAKQEQRSRGF